MHQGTGQLAKAGDTAARAGLEARRAGIEDCGETTPDTPLLDQVPNLGAE